MFKKAMIAASAALCLGLSAGQAKAAKASWQIKNYKESKRFAKRSATFKYQLPVFKGKSKAIKKINQAQVKSYQAAKKDAKSLFKAAQKDKGNDYDYYYVVKSKVTFNKHGIASIKRSSDHYAGASHIRYVHGEAYSLKSGKRLSVWKVVKGGKKNVQAALKKEARALGMSASAADLVDLNTVDYYIGKKGTVYIYPQLTGSQATKSVAVKGRYK